MIPARAIILYLILGAMIFGVTMWLRKDMRESFLSHSHAGRFSIAVMAILAWWMTIVYAIRKEPEKKAK